MIVGSPGVGKSSVAALLASRLGVVNVSLADLIRREDLTWGFDKKRDTQVADTERVAKRVGEIVEGTKGYVVVEGHFAMDVVAPRSLLLAFVLRRDPDGLKAVLEKRGYRREKVVENVAAEILDVCLLETIEAYGDERVCEIDVSGREAEEVVDELVRIVESQKGCRVGMVDWLTKLEAEGRLDEFLGTPQMSDE